jgi:hypothetical protein
MGLAPQNGIIPILAIGAIFALLAAGAAIGIIAEIISVVEWIIS